MTTRMFVALCVLLTLLGVSYGQEPQQPLFTEEQDLVQFTPENDSWITGEYWLGWIQGDNLPVLVTTSDDGTSSTVAGVLGDPATHTVFSGKVNSDIRSGFRFEAGHIFDREAGRGLEAGFSYLGSQSTSFSAKSSDFASGILAQPFIDVSTPATPVARAILIAHPAPDVGSPFTGSVNIKADTGAFYEAHLATSESIVSAGWFNLDGLFGYRYAHFDDGLRIQHQTVRGAETINVKDDFSSSNNFNGVDFGLRARMDWDDFSFNLLGKLAAGSMRREVDIRGNTVTAVGGASTTANGGAYALVSNIGNHSSNQGAVLPEFGANLQWKMTPNLRLKLGYTNLYFNRIARSSNQIDFNINPKLFPGPGFDAAAVPQRPRFNLVETEAWIQSINFGVDYTF